MPVVGQFAIAFRHLQRLPAKHWEAELLEKVHQKAESSVDDQELRRLDGAARRTAEAEGDAEVGAQLAASLLAPTHSADEKPPAFTSPSCCRKYRRAVAGCAIGNCRKR